MGKKIQKNSDPEQRSLLATSDQEGSELNSNLSSDSELEEENENSSLSDQNENSPLEPDLNNSSSSESDEEESQKEKKEENNVDPKVRTQRFVRLDLRKKTGDKESHKENQKWGRKDFVDFEQKVITEDNNKNPVFVFSENFPDCFLATNGMHYHSRNRANLADALRPKKDDEHNVTKVAGVPTLDYSVDKEKTLEERIDESFEYLYWLVGQGHTLVPIYRKKAKNDELEPAFGGGVAKDFSTEHYKHICNRFKQLEDFCEYLDSSSEEKYSDENAKKCFHNDEQAFQRFAHLAKNSDAKCPVELIKTEEEYNRIIGREPKPKPPQTNPETKEQQGDVIVKTLGDGSCLLNAFALWLLVNYEQGDEKTKQYLQDNNKFKKLFNSLKKKSGTEKVESFADFFNGRIPVEVQKAFAQAVRQLFSDDLKVKAIAKKQKNIFTELKLSKDEISQLFPGDPASSSGPKVFDVGAVEIGIAEKLRILEEASNWDVFERSLLFEIEGATSDHFAGAEAQFIRNKIQEIQQKNDGDILEAALPLVISNEFQQQAKDELGDLSGFKLNKETKTTLQKALLLHWWYNEGFEKYAESQNKKIDENTWPSLGKECLQFVAQELLGGIGVETKTEKGISPDLSTDAKNNAPTVTLRHDPGMPHYSAVVGNRERFDKFNESKVSALRVEASESKRPALKNDSENKEPKKKEEPTPKPPVLRTNHPARNRKKIPKKVVATQETKHNSILHAIAISLIVNYNHGTEGFKKHLRENSRFKALVDQIKKQDKFKSISKFDDLLEFQIREIVPSIAQALLEMLTSGLDPEKAKQLNSEKNSRKTKVAPHEQKLQETFEKIKGLMNPMNLVMGKTPDLGGVQNDFNSIQKAYKDQIAEINQEGGLIAQLLEDFEKFINDSTYQVSEQFQGFDFILSRDKNKGLFASLKKKYEQNSKNQMNGAFAQAGIDYNGFILMQLKIELHDLWLINSKGTSPYQLYVGQSTKAPASNLPSLFGIGIKRCKINAKTSEDLVEARDSNPPVVEIYSSEKNPHQSHCDAVLPEDKIEEFNENRKESDKLKIQDINLGKDAVVTNEIINFNDFGDELSTLYKEYKPRTTSNSTENPEVQNELHKEKFAKEPGYSQLVRMRESVDGNPDIEANETGLRIHFDDNCTYLREVDNSSGGVVQTFIIPASDKKSGGKTAEHERVANFFALQRFLEETRGMTEQDREDAKGSMTIELVKLPDEAEEKPEIKQIYMDAFRKYFGTVQHKEDSQAGEIQKIELSSEVKEGEKSKDNDKKSEADKVSEPGKPDNNKKENSSSSLTLPAANKLPAAVSNAYVTSAFTTHMLNGLQAMGGIENASSYGWLSYLFGASTFLTGCFVGDPSVDQKLPQWVVKGNNLVSKAAVANNISWIPYALLSLFEATSGAAPYVSYTVFLLILVSQFFGYEMPMGNMASSAEALNGKIGKIGMYSEKNRGNRIEEINENEGDDSSINPAGLTT